jgi:hypothetical protein
MPLARTNPSTSSPSLLSTPVRCLANAALSGQVPYLFLLVWIYPKTIFDRQNPITDFPDVHIRVRLN